MADPEDAPENDASTDPADKPEHDPAAMADALKKANAEAKKYRLEAKAHADQLAALAQQNMSDNEKAIEAARAEGRTEGSRNAGIRLVDAEVRVAATGRSVDIAALLEGLDRSRFLDEDGEPKTDAIQAWVDRIAPPSDEPAGRPRVPTGVRNPGRTDRTPADDFADLIKNQLNR